ncbi:Aldolase-type TIM barrel [Cynara cardunculus var. scolymus]|uniref:indole-3-glycerol-phosphate synthase n=1 Tax=Cynara cardunculus var. scolymus TaxID=59895 RepID=A0A124SHT9_CYNCS|nr:Aldolase-type TIM barrel [Cynara cardunculus var. scolymus]
MLTVSDGGRANFTCISAQQPGLKDEDDTPRNNLKKALDSAPPSRDFRGVLKEIMKENNSIFSLKKALDNAPPSRDFRGALKVSYIRTGSPGLIAEVKKASPSRGVLREDFHAVEIAKAYESGGAACLSVLTDEEYFQGSFENLEDIRNSGVKEPLTLVKMQCPLLCKDFIVDVVQLYYARIKGADAVLLIAAILPDIDIKRMLKICKKIGLAALVEVHDENEMDRMLGIDGIELLGINNRDLETFEVDISITKKLLEGERGEKIQQKGIISIVKPKDPIQGIRKLFGKDISA